ncbi:MULTISPECIES: hypothetical protein [unclassified Leifsonia]|uniref:hypothetical protein n=1 Tax=unclassified Leifsonia TaxID=2663824 RepID=UPI0008A77E4C|nr:MULTISPECIES: hypothetical protein [unclassified Leifsonia]SEI14039.1 hypothetical protein SAMN04515694_1202 [Leifsonia sp. CL154]SFM01485.1 hypothetical protein SAMN04515692_12154 [Leifsonia sp. CL147]
MKEISAGARTFITGTDIAEAVLRYGLALARHQQVDLVDIPVAVADGRTARAGFTVGWHAGTTTLTTTLADDDEELTEPSTVIELTERARRVGHHGRAFASDELGDELPDFDLDMLSG